MEFVAQTTRIAVFRRDKLLTISIEDDFDQLCIRNTIRYSLVKEYIEEYRIDRYSVFQFNISIIFTVIIGIESVDIIYI